MKSDLMDSARSALAAERWDDAIAAAEAGLAQLADDPELLWIVGWANVKLERFAQAVPFLHDAARQGPVDHGRYWALGLALLESGEFSRAELWLLRALALRDTYDNRIALALVYMKQEESEVAEAIHLEGLRLQPNDAERLDAYADFLSDMARDDEAKEVYEKVRGLSATIDTDKA